jgi:benzoylformate decarboxylase
MIDEAQRPAMPAADDPNQPGAGATRTVRDAVFDVMRRLGMTTIFGNPGSTEIPFLTGLPPDIHFVLGLHEG